MTDYTPEALEALNQKASDARKAYDAHPDHDTLCAFLEHEKRFGYALADLYRTGQLIHAVPSADEVEAVKAGLRKCFDSERPGDDEDKALTLLANAAITAYEAASGVAKMRDALGEKP